MPATASINMPLRRSPLYREHQANGAVFAERSDSELVSYFNENAAVELAQAKSLGIADLTGLSRIGFKGANTVEWLESQGMQLPTEPNWASVGDDALCVARLSHTEFLVLDGLFEPSQKIQALRSAWSLDLAQGTYLLERADSHACFALTGAHVPSLLSKVCGVDMRLQHFEQHQLAQTSVARVNSIVIRSDQSSTPCFFILADLSSAEFMWQGLLDVMQEFSGIPIGLNALISLNDNSLSE